MKSDELRSAALQQALEFYSARLGNCSDSDVVTTAHKFYVFLANNTEEGTEDETDT